MRLPKYHRLVIDRYRRQANDEKNATTLNGVYSVHLNESARINYVRAARDCRNFSASGADYEGYEVLCWDAYCVLRKN